MAEIDLIKNLKNIRFLIPNMIWKLQGYLLREDSKEFLKIKFIKGLVSLQIS